MVDGIYSDPGDLVSFSSDITMIKQLRSELCRLPIKPNKNGLFELYTKEEMRVKFKMPSPNLADSVKMLWRVPKNIMGGESKRPAPLKTMGVVNQGKNRKLRAVN